MSQTLYINLYRSGYWHRQGKPGTCNVHAGDVYDDFDTALRAIEPGKGYIDTIRLEASLPFPLFVNPADAEPTPLRETAKLIARGDLDNPKLLPVYNTDSLDTSEREAVNVPLPWEGAAKASGSPAKAYKPTHGGYPTSPTPEALLGPFEAREQFQAFSEERDDAYCS